MNKIFSMSRRRADSRGDSESKISGLVLQKKSSSFISPKFVIVLENCRNAIRPGVNTLILLPYYLTSNKLQIDEEGHKF